MTYQDREREVRRLERAYVEAVAQRSLFSLFGLLAAVVDLVKAFHNRLTMLESDNSYLYERVGTPYRGFPNSGL